jgi:hypothetical protein
LQGPAKVGLKLAVSNVGALAECVGAEDYCFVSASVLMEKASQGPKLHVQKLLELVVINYWCYVWNNGHSDLLDNGGSRNDRSADLLDNGCSPSVSCLKVLPRE